jgi:hypothetical protein
MVTVPVITQSIFKMDKSPLFLVNWSWFWLDFPTSGLNSCKISQPIYPLTTVTWDYCNLQHFLSHIWAPWEWHVEFRWYIPLSNRTMIVLLFLRLMVQFNYMLSDFVLWLREDMRLWKTTCLKLVLSGLTWCSGHALYRWVVW